MAKSRSLREELDKIYDASVGRALEKREEADRAGHIASRDELVVAGEDTERAATTASNLARQQLGSAAGGGAAAIAGMMAAQSARDKEFAGAVQRARDRKDKFEQKEVERRQEAFKMLGEASFIKQAQLRDDELRTIIDNLMKKRNELQSGSVPQPPVSEQMKENEDEESEEEKERKRKLPAAPLKTEIPSQFPSTFTWKGKEYTKEEPEPYISAYTEFYYDHDMMEAEKLGLPHPDQITGTGSDKRIKKIYKDQGPHTAKGGDAKKLNRDAVAKAEDEFADDGQGISKILVRRFG